MPTLESIQVIGFKSIRDSGKLPLGQINLVVGANGSGKSNLIEVFSLLGAVRLLLLHSYVAKAGGAERLLHFGSKNTAFIRVALAFNDGVGDHQILLQPSGADSLVVVGKSDFYGQSDPAYDPMMEPILSREEDTDLSDPEARRIVGYTASRLDTIRIYHFHDTSRSSLIRKNCDLNDNRGLRADGANLAAFLYFLRQMHQAEYRFIVEAIRRVAPFFDDFILEPQRLNPSKILLEWRHVGSDAYFDCTSLSDGTLRFIALATLLLQPAALRPRVVIVDEPELGLHPYAISLLASLIKQASQDTQIIVSTQSPLLLDHFEPEDVIVAERIDGQSVFRRLDSSKLAEWLEDYSLGQLWEKNEIGGRPTAERA